MPSSIFREYDIRGIFEQELNEDIVKKIGFHLANKLKQKVSSAKYMAVGYDARTHSPILKEWLTSGIKKANLEVLDMGLVATPVNYFSNYIENKTSQGDVKVHASIMITGSHNPPEYNGFKITIDKGPFFGEDIYKLGDEVLDSNIEIEDNTQTIKTNTKEEYINYMIKDFSHLKLENKSFVFDCGNGAAGTVLRDILDGLNINHNIMYETPDGTFPNHHPDPSEVETLEDIKKKLSTGTYDLGFAYDGDADRIALLSKNYNFKGDILAIFFHDL